MRQREPVLDPGYIEALIRDDAAPKSGSARSESSWRPLDLTDALAGVDSPPPALLARTDGPRLLYAGKTHVFAGESESCKSWAAQYAAVEALQAGCPVLYIDFEDDERSVVTRLRSLGASVDVLQRLFAYVRPDEPLLTRDGRTTPGGLDLADVLDLQTWGLIVIDGVTEAMVTEGLDLNSNADVASWSRRLPKRCAATGAATVMVDHVTKSSSDIPSRYAIGGQHKLAGLTGAQYVFKVERPLSRSVRDPVEASIAVKITKDRPGHVRAHAVDNLAARFTLTAYPDGGVIARMEPPGTHATLDIKIAGEIAQFLSDYEGASSNKIEKELGGNNDARRATLRHLVERGENVKRDWPQRARLIWPRLSSGAAAVGGGA